MENGNREQGTRDGLPTEALAQVGGRGTGGRRKETGKREQGTANRLSTEAVAQVGNPRRDGDAGWENGNRF